MNKDYNIYNVDILQDGINELSKFHITTAKKYGITDITVNGWFGINDTFNDYWNHNKKVKRSFNESELDEMTSNPKKYIEC